MLLAQVREAHLWALFARPELPKWQDGHAVLIGDACHPTLPFMAQGAAMGLEDAVVLARCLATDTDQGRALARFEALRKSRTTRLQRQAQANAGLFHRQGALARAQLTLAPWLPTGLALRRFDWIYGYDATGG